MCYCKKQTHIDFKPLWHKESSILYQSALVQTAMEFAVVVTVGSVGGADVAVAGFEEFEDAALVDDSGTAVVG